MPEVYTGDPYAWKKMLDKKNLDGVVIATPWEWHKTHDHWFPGIGYKNM